MSAIDAKEHSPQMSYPDQPPHVDLSEIDLSSTIDYMERNQIARINMTIENVSVDPSLMFELPTTVMAVLERPTSFSENETPSPDGLAGVFFVVRAH